LFNVTGARAVEQRNSKLKGGRQKYLIMFLQLVREETYFA
jgi:hypothetical protein